MKLRLAALALLAIPFPAFAADDQPCKTDASGVMTCIGVVQSNEKRAACQLGDKMGYRPGCADYPLIEWVVQQDRRFAVLIDPGPNRAREASTKASRPETSRPDSTRR